MMNNTPTPSKEIPDHEHFFNEICSSFQLGKLNEAPQPISGGLIHKMWKINSEKGSLAIKELNENIMKKPNVLEEFEQSEKIAQQFKTLGVPAIVGIQKDDHAVQTIEGKYFIVYPWIEGITLSTDPVPPEQSFLIGEVLGKIHQANLNMPEIHDSHSHTFSQEHWNTIFDQLENKLNEQLIDPEKFLEWNHNENHIQKQLEGNHVVSHGDIDQKNVLWHDENQPFIIDWESVNKVHPGVEIVDAALNWGGLVSGTINEASMLAVIHRYKSTGMNLKEDTKLLLQGCILKWLPWLEHNIQKIISSPENSPEFASAKNQILLTVRNIETIFQNLDNWSNLFRQ